MDEHLGRDLGADPSGGALFFRSEEMPTCVD